MDAIEFNGKIYKVYGSEKYYIDSYRWWKRLHIAVWEFYHWPVPQWFEVHHIDENTFNNDMSNLELKPKWFHQSEHMKKKRKDGFKRTIKRYKRKCNQCWIDIINKMKNWNVFCSWHCKSKFHYWKNK